MNAIQFLTAQLQDVPVIEVEIVGDFFHVTTPATVTEADLTENGLIVIDSQPLMNDVVVYVVE